MKLKLVLIVALLTLLLSACTSFSSAEPQATLTPTLGDATALLEPTPTLPLFAFEPLPTALPASTPTATPPAANPADLLARLDAHARPLRDQVELARALGSCRPAPDECPTVARETPLDVEVGYTRPFFVTNFDDNTNFELNAQLHYAGPVVLMYVEEGLSFNQAALEWAAQHFEQEIYPRTREIFGSEAQPGVDGDLRITILNARDPSGRVLGYYSSQDSLPRQVNRYSNEREMFFMNIALMPFEDPKYLDVLAHEFQHMIHQHEQPGSAIWFNEGASQLASDLNGYVHHSFPLLYLANPDVQLTSWRSGPGRSGGHYGAAHLFMRYIYAQYAGEAQIRPLIRANAGKNLEAFVTLAAQTHPDIQSFGTLVANWAVANLIDDPEVGDGRYTYATGHELPNLLTQRIRPVPVALGRHPGSLAQFGAAYMELPNNASHVSFEGASLVPLVGAQPLGQSAWWSFYGDDSVATLTGAFDLRELERATLQFDAWYEIELDYDYAFVSVSTDDGLTWETLPGTLTTDYDPQGVNYGFGITGISGHPGADLDDHVRGIWVEERMDLTPYVGQEILLRFWQINDQALEGAGIMLDNIAIPELDFLDDAESDAAGWAADGFVRVSGELPQQWEVRLVRRPANGLMQVENLEVAADGSAEAQLQPDERAVLVLVPTTPHTQERASYVVLVE
ncbi:immune inhibitor A domain-containing protein [Candidatus Viridilinea mediisalina]|uniref:Uncharacterized protein n=1 Tax=Candidatus Viridilinea mediisalina TaxID=2024553 RepID=A0A2A6RL00_9CHLR|nr:immune inhibitor A domain-containing protein [Candidatus Viridilinea mediisalina]PDW03794.1 hypothetical protein CJ255_06985 [Candidatus Viridilinea mediisalina]